MDQVALARMQFGITIAFHYIFPPLTIGLAWLLVWMTTLGLRTGREIYRTMARFWLRIFALSFAVGVATGIAMEFQFGTNWAAYSRFVGDIFGAPLAAEGLFAFFLESVFLGLLLFGGERLSPRLRWVATLMVAVGSTLSAFWIIAANSWQQTPAGFVLRNGRAELTSFWQALFNPSTLPRYLHVVDSALITGALFVAGLAARYLLRREHRDFALASLRGALGIGLVAALLQLPLGHYHAVQVARTQPVKLAAYEALFDTQRNAPMLLFGIPNAAAGRTDLAVPIPGLLSLLVGFDTATEVKGLNDFPRADWPPLRTSAATFHLMVGLGLYFIGFTLLGSWLAFKGRLESTPWFLRLAFWSIPLPFLAGELGWVAAEVGRQPWSVYGILRTADSVSTNVPAAHVLATLLLFIAVYSMLFALWLFLIAHKLRQGPDAPAGAADREVRP